MNATVQAAMVLPDQPLPVQLGQAPVPNPWRDLQVFQPHFVRSGVRERSVSFESLPESHQAEEYISVLFLQTLMFRLNA